MTTRSRLTVVAMFFCLLMSAGCGGGGGGGSSDGDGGGAVDDGGGPAPANATTLRISTFNAGLLPTFVPLTDERVPVVASAVAGLETDVLCLQEVWRSGDAAAVSAALSQSFGSVFVAPPRQKLSSAAPVCSSSDLDGVVSCAVSECLLAGIGVFECLVGTCHDSLEQLGASNPQCAEAITAQTGRSISEIFDIQNELFSEQPAGLFAFGGSPGIILAAKRPLENIQVLDFFDASTTSRRVAVFATVNVNGVLHRVGCTHLQSNLDGLIPYTGRFGSWAGEQRAQAERMIAFADGYGGGDPQYLAGDFNCGFTAGGVNSELEENCALFSNAGFADPVRTQLGCTFCAGNLLNVLNASLVESRDVQLDHVFTRNAIYSGQLAERVLDAVVSAGGQQVNVSDHFGVRLSAPVP